MKLSIILIRTAGAICLLFAIFHVFFHKLFNWPESLSCLDVNNRAILLTYHYISILILGFMAITAIFQAKAILKSQLKYSILSMFALFFLIRIYAEFSLFGISQATPVILIICLIPVICFALPIFINTMLYESKKTV